MNDINERDEWIRLIYEMNEIRWMDDIKDE